VNRRSFLKSVSALLLLAPERAAKVKSAEAGFKAIASRRPRLPEEGFVYCPGVPLWVTLDFDLKCGGKGLLKKEQG